MSKEFSRTIPINIQQQLIPSFARKLNLNPDQPADNEPDASFDCPGLVDNDNFGNNQILQVAKPLEAIDLTERLKMQKDVFISENDKFLDSNKDLAVPGYIKKAVKVIEQNNSINLNENSKNNSKDQSLSEKLITILPPEVYNKTGTVLRSLLKEGSIKQDEVILEMSRSFADFPQNVLEEIIDSFTETGFIKKSGKDKIKLSKLGERRPSLGYWEIKGVFTSNDALKTSHKPIDSWDDVIDAQEIAQDKFRVPDVEIKTNNGNKTLFLDGIIVGSSVTDTAFVKQVIESVKELPSGQKPDAIIIGNIIEGTHKHTNVDATVGLSLKRSEDQFLASKRLIEMLREIGAPIVYVMGVNDRIHIRDGAIEAFRAMQNEANPLKDSQKQDYLTPEDVHKIQSHRDYPKHKVFEHDVVFEYMLRTGRGLMSADEVQKFTAGSLRMEEYVMLWDSYKALKTSWSKGHHKSFIPAEVIPTEYQKVIDVNSIPGPWIKDSFTVTDGANVSLEGKKDSEVTIWVRNRFKMDGPTLHQEIMANPIILQKELTMNGEAVPDILVSTGNYEGVVTATRHGVILDLPGMVSSREVIDMQAMYAQAGKNPAMRAVFARKRPTEPGAIMTALKDGVTELSFYDKKLMQVLDSVPDTTIYAAINDWQIGSPTTDYRRGINWIRHVIKDLPNRGNVRLKFLGDLTHGGNVYSGFKNESPGLGLHRVPDQYDMLEEVLEGITSDMSKSQIQKRVEKILIAAGNHEYDGSDYDKTGINGVRDTDRLIRSWYGVERNDPRVVSSERILTKEGDFLDAHIVKDKIGEVTIVGQHKILNKFAKGNQAGLPVYQAIDFLRGLGMSASDINIALFAHWHHFQALMHQHMLMAVAPALAKESGFEMRNGYQAVTGGMAVVLEPGMPVKILHYNQDALDRLQPKGGMFSYESLAREGFANNDNFDPKRDSQLVPISAIHKKVDAMRRKILTRYTEF